VLMCETNRLCLSQYWCRRLRLACRMVTQIASPCEYTAVASLESSCEHDYACGVCWLTCVWCGRMSGGMMSALRMANSAGRAHADALFGAMQFTPLRVCVCVCVCVCACVCFCE
jgi:hypothetical protein